MTKQVSLVIGTLALVCSCASSDADRPSRVTGLAGLQAETIGGVWVFYQDLSGSEGSGYDDALHSGVAAVVDGCLFVGDAIVVWHPDRSEDAQAAIDAALDAEQPTLSVGGGGVSVDEGDSIPSEIAARCPTETVWFAAPGGLRVER